MGFGKHGIYTLLIGITGLIGVHYISKTMEMTIPYVEWVSLTFGSMFIIGLVSAYYGGKAHGRKHGWFR